MSSYFNPFGGNTVTTAQTGYLAFPLNANSTFYWPNQFIDIPVGSTTRATIASIMAITPGGGGLTITMPDARLVSPGQTVIFVNRNATAFNLLFNGGGVLATIGANATTQLYLADNSTQNGTWGTFAYAGGVAAVTSIGMAITAGASAANLTVVSSTTNPIVANGTFTLTLAGDLLALGSLATTGYATRTAANTWATRTFSGTANQITLTNPAGIAGGTTFALANDVSGIQSLEVLNGIKLEANVIENTGVGNIELTPQEGYFIECIRGLVIDGNGENLGTNQVQFYDETNEFYTSLQAPDDLSADIQYVLPSSAPALGQVLYAVNITPPITLGWATIPTFPGVSTTNAIAKYLNTTGSLNNSGVLIDAFDAITGVTSLTSGNVIIAGNTISTSVGALILDPNGASLVQVTGLTYPASTNTGNIESCVLTADGANNIVFSANVNDNLLVNGAMDIWQRNTNFTSATFFQNDSGIYTADGWWLESGIGAGAAVDDVVNVTQTARAFNTATCSFSNVMRFTVVNTGNKFVNFQFIEATKTAKVSGQVASFSFVCAGSTATNIRAALVSWTGAADTLTKPVISTFNNVGTNPTLAASYAYLGTTPVNTPITANLTRFKFQNISVPNTCNNLVVMVWYDDAVAANATTLDMGAIKVEQGPSCTAFKPEEIEIEAIKCQRYFRKSWPLATPVGTAATIVANAIVSAAVSPIADTLTYGTHKFEYPMRTTPATLNLYAVDATQNVATELAVNGTAGSNQAANSAIVLLKDSTGFTIKNNSTGNITSASTAYIVHYYADASL